MMDNSKQKGDSMSLSGPPRSVQSRPRLRQSGHLFGQQYFVQQACPKKGNTQG